MSKRRVETEPWWCRAGHVLDVVVGAKQVFCGRSGHAGTNEMKPRALFPSWGPSEPPDGEGRRCCSTYRDEPHVEGCRYYREG